jgi:hypothetical protein
LFVRRHKGKRLGFEDYSGKSSTFYDKIRNYFPFLANTKIYELFKEETRNNFRSNNLYNEDRNGDSHLRILPRDFEEKPFYDELCGDRGC